jgi:hypothetical protein
MTLVPRLLLAGLLFMAAAAPTRRPATLLDSFLPASHYRNTQSTRAGAPPWAVFAAVRSVTPAEVHGLKPFAMAFRAPSFRLTPTDEALLRRPMIDAMLGQNFVLLGERPGEEIVVGAIGRFWAERYVPLRDAAAFRAFRDPRFARVAMNVRVRSDGKGGAVMTTEARVLCPDPSARSQFDRFWRLWSPGGRLVRGQWLAAVKRRAEQSSSR